MRNDPDPLILSVADESHSFRIPRAEVEEIAALVHREMENIRSGSQYTICGGASVGALSRRLLVLTTSVLSNAGYRRGKKMSGDVDLVVSECRLALAPLPALADPSYRSQLIQITRLLLIETYSTRSFSA